MAEPWHHLFGLTWMDFLQDTEVTVSEEKDLSLQQQFLDLVILRPQDHAPLPRRLPDGFDDQFANHNLVTFKSHRESLNDDALLEMVGHFVNYCKQENKKLESKKQQLSRDEVRCFAVCVCSPHNLISEGYIRPLQPSQPGVYEAPILSLTIRVVVIHELPPVEHNAMLLLFSAKRNLLEYAEQNYRPYSATTSTLLYNLVARYRLEGIPMPENLEQFHQRAVNEMLQSLPVEKRLEGVPAEKLLERVPPEKRLEGLSPEKRLEGLSTEELVKGLSPEQLEALTARLRQTQE